VEKVWRFAFCCGVLGYVNVVVLEGRIGGREGTVWKYPGAGACVWVCGCLVDFGFVSFDFESIFDVDVDGLGLSGVNKLSPSPRLLLFPLVASAFNRALSSLFALALSPPLANISFAAAAFLSASSLAILSRFCILAIRRVFWCSICVGFERLGWGGTVTRWHIPIL